MRLEDLYRNILSTVGFSVNASGYITYNKTPVKLNGLLFRLYDGQDEEVNEESDFVYFNPLKYSAVSKSNINLGFQKIETSMLYTINVLTAMLLKSMLYLTSGPKAQGDLDMDLIEILGNVSNIDSKANSRIYSKKLDKAVADLSNIVIHHEEPTANLLLSFKHKENYRYQGEEYNGATIIFSPILVDLLAYTEDRMNFVDLKNKYKIFSNLNGKDIRVITILLESILNLKNNKTVITSDNVNTFRLTTLLKAYNHMYKVLNHLVVLLDGVESIKKAGLHEALMEVKIKKLPIMNRDLEMLDDLEYESRLVPDDTVSINLRSVTKNKAHVFTTGNVNGVVSTPEVQPQVVQNNPVMVQPAVYGQPVQQPALYGQQVQQPMMQGQPMLNQPTPPPSAASFLGNNMNQPFGMQQGGNPGLLTNNQELNNILAKL